MKLGSWLGGALLGSAGLLVYGALVESKKLTLEKMAIGLPKWPSHLNGYRIALLADFHLCDAASCELAWESIDMALREEPDMVCIAGDFVSYWKDESEDMLLSSLDLLRVMNGNAVAIPGNHEYVAGTPDRLAPVLKELNVTFLRNDSWNHDNITWVGVDSANASQADPLGALISVSGDLPIITLWHEPDRVDCLPPVSALMLSGHSHGGQFCAPWGWAPMTSKNGNRYRRGFFPDAPTPLYVSRGIGTTGPPSRLFCTPEVTILDLISV